MRGIFGKIKAPDWYPQFCGAMAALGWLPFFFGQPMIHGGSLLSVAFGWAGMVLRGYCCLELVRAHLDPWRKIAAFIGCIIYGAAVGFGLYYALPYIPRLLAA
jgi:hypothetical protein